MRYGLAIGINYTGTPHELGGCINDANTWASFFTAGGFDVELLLEREATAANFRKRLKKLVGSLQAGDTGVVTYSGHGTWLPDRSQDESDGRDEAFVPIDIGKNGKNLILDDEINDIFSNLATQATLLFITDCCHSGTIYRMFVNGPSRMSYRFLPPTSFIDDAEITSAMDREYGQPNRKRAAVLSNVIHFSGCRDAEYSIDAEIDGVSCGAFTHYAVEAFRQAVEGKHTYNDVFKAIRRSLPSQVFPQTPQLNATTNMKKRKVFG